MAIVIPGTSRLQRRLRVLPVLGSRLGSRDLLMAGDSDGPFAESFRLLALNINAALARKPSKGVVVISAFAQDGRSLIAANLAMALAERQATILHDGHVRAPKPVGRLFNPAAISSNDNGVHSNGSSAGLPSALVELARPAHGPRLWLTDSRNPHSLDASRLGEIARTASSAGIITVVDSPPATLSSEAFALAQEVGQVLYVVRRVAQNVDVHRQIREQLRRLDAEVIALVMNEA